MTSSTVMGLINNTALLLALGLLYDTLLFSDSSERFSISQFLAGLIIGCLGIAVMATRWEFAPGVVFDTRSVLLGVSGLFFGAVPTVIAVVITAAFRLYSGGLGMWTGVAVIVTSGGIGLAWRHFRAKHLNDATIGELYLFGLIVHAAMLLWMFSLPRPVAVSVVSKIGVPVMLIFPAGTALLGKLMATRQKRQKIEMNLRKSQKELADIFSMSLDMICLADINTATFLKVNPAFTRVLGFSENELLDSALLDFIHPEDARSTAAALEGRLTGHDTIVDFVNRCRCKNGDYRWLKWIAQTTPESGVIFAVAHDITNSRISGKRLQESEAFITSVMDNLPIGIAVNSVDPAVQFEYINDNFLKYYKTTREALAAHGGFWTSVYEEPVFRQKIKKRILDDCASGDPGRMHWIDVPIARAGEATRYITARNIPIPEKRLMISTVWDVTDRKQAEEEIKALNRDLESRVFQRTAQLEETNKELEDFVYSVSHDLRAPLRSIGGFAEIIDRRHKASLNAEGQHYFDNIVKASRQMGVLIDDLLKFSRLGRKAIQMAPVALEDALKTAIKTLSEQINDAGATIHLPSRMPTVQGDPTLATHIFINLLENAVKYRKPDERPHIDIGTESGDGQVIVSVSDNGIGIEPAYHEKIFNIFQRLHNQEAYPGTGIGLAAVKKAAQVMGGRVWVESEPLKGSVFKILFLPVQRSQSEGTMK